MTAAAPTAPRALVVNPWSAWLERPVAHLVDPSLDGRFTHCGLVIAEKPGWPLVVDAREVPAKWHRCCNCFNGRRAAE
jgi:hypothetical protein